MQQPFDDELQQHDLNVLAAFPGEVAQAGLNGGSEVLWRSVHTMASRYGRIVLATRLMVA